MGGQHRQIGPVTCQNPFCGKAFYYPWHGRKRHYCSRTCGSGGHGGGVLGGIIRTAVSDARWAAQKCANLLQREFRKGQRQIKQQAEKARNNAGRKCKLCGNWFARGGDVINISKHCLECRNISDRIERCGAAYEYVNPRTVFERDKWTCQHCGYAVPDWLRGDAVDGPQLDHILPIARGGAHSYANTQCLCGKCNVLKCDKTEREPRLRRVKDLTPFTVAKNPGRKDNNSREHQTRICACGCGQEFTTWISSNNDTYKAGHWMRVFHDCWYWAQKRLNSAPAVAHISTSSRRASFRASGLSVQDYIRQQVWA